MALGSFSVIIYQFLDHSDERKSLKIPIADFTGATLPTQLLLWTDVEDALDAVTLGNRSRNEFGTFTNVTNTPPASANAQIETEMLVRLRSVTTEVPYSFRIPTVDYAAFNYIGDEVIIAGAGATAATLALVTAINAVAREPVTNEALAVVGMSVAG